MALSDGDYSGAFGPFGQFDPAMARVMQNDPEALIPYLAASGQRPPGPEFAENFAPRFDASFPGSPQTPTAQDFIPPSGTVGDQNIYAQPPGTPGGPATKPMRDQNKPPPEQHLSTSDVLSRAQNYYTPLIPQPLKDAAASVGSLFTQPPNRDSPLNIQNYLKPDTGKKADDRVAEGKPGRVDPNALGKNDGVTTGPNPPDNGRVADTEVEPPPRASVVDSEGNPVTEGGRDKQVALPTSAPGKASASTDADTFRANLAKGLSGLSGVRMPPAPPQPQLRPFAGERPNAMPSHDALVALLSQAISGGPQGTQALRLLQAVGGK